LLVAAAWYQDQHEDLRAVSRWGFALALLFGTAAIHARSFAARQVGLGAWWSVLVAGTASAVCCRHEMSATGGAITALAPGAGLLLLGSEGLVRGTTHGPCTPAAFKNLLGVVLATTTGAALTLGYVWGLRLGWSALGAPLPDGHGLLACSSLALGVGVVGLMYLKVWALVWSVVASLLIATLALTGGLPLPTALAMAVGATMVLHAALPIPVIWAIATGRRPRLRLKRGTALCIVAALMALAGARLCGYRPQTTRGRGWFVGHRSCWTIPTQHLQNGGHAGGLRRPRSIGRTGDR